jgi:hypothetical protein
LPRCRRFGTQQGRSPLHKKQAGACRRAGCRASLRTARVHGGVRPQPGGFNHLLNVATRGGRHGVTERPGCVRSGSSCFADLLRAADATVAQAAVDEDEQFAAHRGAGHVCSAVARRCDGSALSLGPPRPFDTASMAVQGTSVDPAFVTRPRWGVIGRAGSGSRIRSRAR